MDRVDDVSDQVQLAGGDGNFEFSVPLATLGLQPTGTQFRVGDVIRGDLGVLRGNGFQTLHRAYWSNKATAIVSDVPSEAILTPQLWGAGCLSMSDFANHPPKVLARERGEAKHWHFCAAWRDII